MANEFIEKEIMKERTGANVTPIQVDTQSRYLLNPTNVEGVSVKTPSKIPVHENMFIEAIGKIAKESEQLKLNNEKNLLFYPFIYLFFFSKFSGKKHSIRHST